MSAPRSPKTGLDSSSGDHQQGAVEGGGRSGLSLHIKEEEEELWGSHKGERVGEEEEKPSSLELPWRRSEEVKAERASSFPAALMKRQSYGGGAKNPDPNGAVLPRPDGQTPPESLKTEVFDDDDDDDDDDEENWQKPLSDSEVEPLPVKGTATGKERSRSHPENGKPFGCDVCGKFFARKTHLNEHKRVHTGEKPFSCDVCRQHFAQKSNLIVHMRVHTGEKPFGCDVCGLSFSHKSVLNAHTRVHSGERPFSCDTCQKSFTLKSTLQAHMIRHTGEKPFSCDFCCLNFAHKAILNKHVRIHTGEKPFGCEVCGKRFTQKAPLRDHMRIHTGEKPYSCDVCQRSFTQKSNLKAHMKVHT